MCKARTRQHASTLYLQKLTSIKINPFQNGAPESPRAEGGNRSETKNPAPYTLHAKPLLEKALEKSMRPSSLHIGCARSAQRACAKRVRQHASTLYLQKLTSRQRQQQSAQCTKHASNQASPIICLALLRNYLHIHKYLYIYTHSDNKKNATRNTHCRSFSVPDFGHIVGKVTHGFSMSFKLKLLHVKVKLVQHVFYKRSCKIPSC